jgi:hypothetical protein
MVQNYWHMNALDVDLKPNWQAVAAIYSISVLLTNIISCLRGNTVSIRYGIPPLQLDVYLQLQIEISEG